MATAQNISGEKAYGPNGNKVAEIVQRLSKIKWYSDLGKADDRQEVEQRIRSFANGVGADVDAVRWVSKEELPRLLQEHSLLQGDLWDKLSAIPEKIRERAERSGRLELLSYALDDVPEMVFHGSFDGAFKAFGEKEEKTIEIAVGAAMVAAGLACAWEMVSDAEDQTPNPFVPLIEVFERGHWPLGIIEDRFAVI